MTEKRQVGVDGFQRFTISEASGRLEAVSEGEYMRVVDHQQALYRQVESSSLLRRRAEKNAVNAMQEAARLRDGRRFDAAKAALQGFLSQDGGLLKDYIPCASKYAEASVAMADALLAELDRPREEPGPLHEDD